jgi:ribonucleotide monophosphatase NagD (HAD superfamily)
LFDVDGVLARGSTPLSAAQQAIRLLEDEEGHLKVPVAFVTNACNRSNDKAAQIQKWLNIQVGVFEKVL